MIEVKTQAQLEKALKRTLNGADELIVCIGGGHFTLWENSTATLRENSTATLWGNSTATLRGNSTATLRGNSTATLRGNSTATLWENSTATLWENSTATLRGNSTATLRENSTATLRENSTATLRENSTATLRGNSTATLRENSTATLRGNSTATLRENSTARAFDRSNVKATPNSPVLRHSKEAKISGGQVLDMHSPQTAEEWCEFYGIEIRKGGGFRRDLKGQDVAILFKALYADFRSYHRFSYDPGTVPAAPDWDGGKRECGGGLHFSPHPVMAEEFQPDAERYVACPVLVSEIVIHPDGMYPQKCKAPRACAPCWEVDRNGERIE